MLDIIDSWHKVQKIRHKVQTTEQTEEDNHQQVAQGPTTGLLCMTITVRSPVYMYTVHLSAVNTQTLVTNKHQLYFCVLVHSMNNVRERAYDCLQLYVMSI